MTSRTSGAPLSFLEDHAALLLDSFRRVTGRELMASVVDPSSVGLALFEAPFVVVSHDRSPDPIFNYGNLCALELFEMSWKEFTALPSRLSAEPLHRDERQRLLDTVSRPGYIDDYRGIRISKSGRPFAIERATVWNLISASGEIAGQAATFCQWTPLD